MGQARGGCRPGRIGRIAITTSVVAIVCTTGSCRGREAATVGPSSSVLRLGFGQASSTDPFTGLAQLAQNLAVEALVRPGEDGRLQPWLAESWTTGSNVRSLNVRLRSGAKFPDGSPFAAK